ncbi:MAG: CpXC domain-containing protein [Elusimicrobia bacterium]|nr:CpXC domain-containing protein [Elusimicrobiota bacterium]
MATKGVFRVECPHCGEGFDADFWTVVRGDRDADVKELILSGEFDILMCPKCETMFQHEEPFLYMDPSRDLLAFVMPEAYLEKKEEWLARMKTDYEPLRASISSGQGLTGEPLYFFGLGPLTALLEDDRDREEETEVLEFMAREAGLNLLPVKPASARELDIPFSIPMPAGLGGRAAALNSASSLREKNDALPRLKKLVDHLSALKGEDLPFLKR